MRKRIISLLLSAVMLVSMFNITMRADAEEIIPSSVESVAEEMESTSEVTAEVSSETEILDEAKREAENENTTETENILEGENIVDFEGTTETESTVENENTSETVSTMDSDKKTEIQMTSESTMATDEGVIADVYILSENNIYTKIEEHDELRPLDLKNYDGKTLFVLSKSVPQNLYFYCRSLVYTEFLIEGTDYAVLNAKDKNALVTLSENIPAQSEIKVTGKLMLASYTVKIHVLDELPQAPIPDERPLEEQLKSGADLQSMVNAITKEDANTESFIVDDVIAVEERMEELYLALENPSDKDKDNYDAMMNQMLVIRRTLGMCVCGSSTNDHGSFCPQYSKTVATKAKSRSINALRSADLQNVNDNIEINKWVTAPESESEQRLLTMEAYATGTTVTTQSTKPADIVLIVDQSASMLYGDSTHFSPQPPASDTLGAYPEATAPGGLTREYMNTDEAKQHGKMGLYYLAYGYNTLCFMVYDESEGIWKYFDTYLSKTGNTHPHLNNSNITGAWDGNVFKVLDDWDTFYSKLEPMTETTWSNFQKYGIYPTRFGPVYEALVQFVNDISDDGVDHRIAVVGFGGRDEAGSELFINGTGIQRNSIRPDDYKNAFKNVKDEELYPGIGQKNQIENSINALLPNMCWTHHDSGFKMANGIFENNQINMDERDRIVIFFSDGEGSSYSNDTWSRQDAATAKQVHGAKVYSIGIEKARIDLMKYVSSNYPLDNGTDAGASLVGEDAKYYIPVDDSSKLNDAFASISTTVGNTTTTLDKTAYIKDVVTKYFVIPEGANSVSAYTVLCTGYRNGVPQWSTEKIMLDSTCISVEGNTVIVNGFDYAANYVSEGGRKEGTTDEDGDFHGRKVVIEIDIVPHEDFVGGNQVETNESTSGLYDGSGNSVDVFPIPKTDVELAEIELVVKDIYLYVGSEASQYLTVEKINRPFTLWQGDHPIALDNSKENWGLEWQDDYAEISFILLDKNGNEMIDGLSDVREDTQYSVKVRVTPKYSGNYEQKVDSNQADIYVFYPELTFHDKTYWYGEVVPDSNSLQNAKISLKWKNKEQAYSTAPLFNTGLVELIGSEPAVEFSCIPSVTGTLPKTDVGVDVTVTRIGYVTGNDLNSEVWFKWNACTPDCGLNVDQQNLGQKGNVPEFYLHMNNCRLTISKTGGSTEEPYVFTLLKDGKKYSELSITGNGEKVLYELPVGNYTIQEDTKWSWRYHADNGNSATLNRNNPEDKITCTNTKNEEKWLDGFSTVVTNIFGMVKNE